MIRRELSILIARSELTFLVLIFNQCKFASVDFFIDAATIIRRTIQYGFYHYPEYSREEHYQRMVAHLHEKYGRNGYLHLWFEDSPNAQRLRLLQDIIDDEATLVEYFNQYFDSQD